MLRATAALAVAGLLLVVLAPGVPLALLGALLWGAGAALGFPVGMSAAADDPHSPAVRVSVVSSIGYTAFLAGPPLIGVLGEPERLGILRALLVVLGALLVGAAVAHRAAPPPGRTAADVSPPALRRSHVDVPTPDGPADAYLTRPAGPGPYPPVLLFMDALGLRPRLEEMADRIAAQGHVVLVPNLFHRAHRADRAPVVPDLAARLQAEDRASVMAELGPLMRALTPEVAARDTLAHVVFLDAQAEVAPGPVADDGLLHGRDPRAARGRAAPRPGRGGGQLPRRQPRPGRPRGATARRPAHPGGGLRRARRPRRLHASSRWPGWRPRWTPQGSRTARRSTRAPRRASP